jgi:putative transposase
MHGGMIVVVDRWYPSRKTYLCCGHKREALPLLTREWACSGCGTEHDRDVNAAITLKNRAVNSTAWQAERPVSACGEEGPGSGRKIQVRPSSVQ